MKIVTMTAADWRNVADEALEHAIGWLHNDSTGTGRAGAIARSAEMLRARDVLHGRANVLALSGGEDTAEIEE